MDSSVSTHWLTRKGLLVVLAVVLAGCAVSNVSRGTFTNSSDPSSSIEARSGESSCDTESVTFLRIEDDVYARDPRGVLSGGSLIGDYRADVELPDDAIDSGYESTEGDESIWFASDRTSIFVVDQSGTTDEWPQVNENYGCD